MQIKYSKSNEINVSGTIQELLLIRQDILHFVGSSSSSFVIEAETNVDSSLYETNLSRMVCTQGEGPVKISVVDGEQLQVEGSRQSLEAFASFFNFVANAYPANHHHYEYYEGNEWVSAESEPIVVSVW